MGAKGKAILAVSLVALVFGCSGGVTDEQRDAAYTMAQQGQVQELKALVQQNKAIATTPSRGDDHLLEIVVDIRPPFPNMHQTMEVLLEAGADPNHDAPELLRKAIWRGDPEGFEILLKHGADPRVVHAKKKIDMLEYAGSKNDSRFDAIVSEWQAVH